MTADPPHAPRTSPPQRGRWRPRPGAWRWGAPGLALVLTAAGAATIVGDARADTAWDCSGAASVFTVAGSQTTVHSIDMSTGLVEETRTMPHAVGGVAYNAVDGMVYGWDQQARAIVRIDAELAVTQVALVPLVTRQVMSLSAIDAAGQMWLSSTNPADSTSREWFKVDLAPGSPTYGEVVDAGNWAPPAGLFVPADWVVVGTTLLGLAASHLDPTVPVRIVGLDTATGAMVDHGPVSGLTSSSQFGGAWIGPDGRLQASRNTGTTVAVDLATAQGEELADNPDLASGNMDATHCGTLPPAPTPTPTSTPTPTPTPPPATDQPTASPGPVSLPSPSSSATPVTPADERAPQRSGMLLHASPHASARGASQDSSVVLTLVNSGNTVLRRPTVSMRVSGQTQDVDCALPVTVAVGASASCMVTFRPPGSSASPAPTTEFAARAVTGASTSVTSMWVPLRTAPTRPGLALSVESRLTSHAVLASVVLRNTGTHPLTTPRLNDLVVGTTTLETTRCDPESAYLLPGDTFRCELRIPLTLLQDDRGRLPRQLDLIVGARATPTGWATPVTAPPVTHHVDLGGR